MPASQGINEAFSTGSQNRNPPRPGCSRPSKNPSRCRASVRLQAISAHGRMYRAQAASTRPLISAAAAKENTIEKPT